MRPRQIRSIAQQFVREIILAEISTGSINEMKIASTILARGDEDPNVQALAATLTDEDVIAVECEVGRIVDVLKSSRYLASRQAQAEQLGRQD